MPLDAGETYKLLVTDTAHISDRRQTMNGLYLSVNSLLLGALAILAQQAQLESVTLLVLEIFVAFAGWSIAGHWLEAIEKYRGLLQVRYAVLRTLEQESGAVPEAGRIYTIENKTPAIFGFSDIEVKLPKMFRWLYLIGTLLLFGGTMVVRHADLFALLRSLGLPV